MWKKLCSFLLPQKRSSLSASAEHTTKQVSERGKSRIITFFELLLRSYIKMCVRWWGALRRQYGSVVEMNSIEPLRRHNKLLNWIIIQQTMWALSSAHVIEKETSRRVWSLRHHVRRTMENPFQSSVEVIVLYPERIVLLHNRAPTDHYRNW